MAKRFNVNLSNPSFGVIVKGEGVVTVLETAEPPPPPPPTPVKENNFAWECLFDNMEGASVTSVAHNCENGYEYMCAHIDLAGENEINWSHAAKFIDDDVPGSTLGQGIDSGISFSETAGITVDAVNHTATIIRVLRRPLPVAVDEDSRITGNEFVKVSGSSLNYQWDLDYEYYIQCYSGSRNFTAKIITDKVVYEGFTKLDGSNAWIAAVDTNRGRWVGFDHKKSAPGNKSFRKVRLDDCSLFSIWRRPWKATTVDASEFENEHKRIKNSASNPPSKLTFDWKDEKEYLVLMGDHSGDNEISCGKVLTLKGLLEVPGVDRHRAGISTAGGGFSWYDLVQFSSGGTKRIECHSGGTVLSILVRDIYLDAASCGDEAGPVNKLTFETDTPGITRYGSETYDLSSTWARAFIGKSWGNNTPDTFNDKYDSSMEGIAIAVNNNVANREVNPTSAYHARSDGATSFGWYLSAISKNAHPAALKYVNITSLSLNQYVSGGHTLFIKATNLSDGNFSIDENSQVTNVQTNANASMQDVYNMRTNSMMIEFEDHGGTNYSGIDAEVSIGLEFEFEDGTKFNHLLVLKAQSGGY